MAQLKILLITILAMLGPKVTRSKSVRSAVKAERIEMKGTTRRKGPPKGKTPPQLRPYLFKKGQRSKKRK